VCAAELAALGIRGVAESGGVAWTGTRQEMYLANLRLRTAGRVLVRIATFNARTFFELERHARKLPWEHWVRRGGSVRLRVTSRKSKLYHEGAIAQRLLGWIGERVGGLGDAGLAKGTDEDDDAGSAQVLVIRVMRDEVTVSADSSGALLHLRGYRQAVAKAPLRETLGAAMLLACGWDGGMPLVDPMCGSGTLPIEAALIARRIAPGLASADRAPRAYAFQQWPGFDASAWDAAVDAARAEILPSSPTSIAGSDRDAGAIEAAVANAARAGVEGDVDLSVLPLSAITPAGDGGLLIANPPYGVRVGETDALRNLYAALGRVARTRAAGWTLALLSADPRLEGQVKVPFREVFRTSNGGIPVRLVAGRVPPG
jgi:putative N6-adenine-specific DNA methylase